MSERSLSRRGFIGAGAAAGVAAAGAGAPTDAEAGRRRRRRPRGGARRVDVAVIGAGLAGLTAAREIARTGRSVTVLEARGRVGGRVASRSVGGGDESERGGTFVGPTQGRIMALAESVGVETFPTYNIGENVYYVDGERSTFSDTAPTGSAPSDPQILADLATVVTRLNEMSREVPVDAPHESPSAAAYDGQTLETWIAENSVNPRFERLAAAATRPIFGAEPRELSLLFTLFYIAASGDERTPGTFERNFNTRMGAQESRFVGGSALICERVAEELGRRIVLRSPVSRIVQPRRGRVRIESERVVAHAKRVIVALPPTLAGRIDYSPKLPFLRDSLHQRLPQGTLCKVAAVYDRPFWREKGLTGAALSLNGPVTATFDDSPPDGSPGVLFGFVGGDFARGFLALPREERRTQVLADFARFFGPEGAQPLDYFESNWPVERFSRGGPVGILGPGVLTGPGPVLRTPVDRIRWAGTETSTYWNGYMDGAVRSGERAAREVLDQL